MKLIIAEKPNQAKEYANALGNFERKDGYFQNSHFFITWCFGHLVELERDTKYREAGNWSKSYLPLIPTKFLYKVGSDNKGKEDLGKKKQLKIIDNLISQSSEIINGTDADREGELIFRYVYNYLNCKLPFKRLWISSLTEGDIKKGFDNLLSDKELDHLGKSAYARAIADWLVGVNGTQASTLQFGSGTLLTIGRVQTAILKIICERFLKNKNFQKSFSYKIKAKHYHNVEFFSESDIFHTKNETEQLIKTLDPQHICQTIEKKIVKQNPPLLFSIDTLIIEANRKYGYTGQQTLDTAQSLYEKKLTSYPRTDNEYINEENYDHLKSFLPVFGVKYLQKDFSFSIDKPKSVNNAKLTGSHDAIVPTGHNEAVNLSEIETNVFLLIISRCLQSFSSAAVYEKMKIVFDNKDVEFFTYSSKLLDQGWKSYLMEKSMEVGEEQEINLELKEDEKYSVLDFSIKEIESKPPILYSDVNLTQDLTNVGKLLKEESPELLKEISANIDINKLQIGTQATRPSIIERLKSLGFIELTKNKYIPTEKGLKYYSILKPLEISNIVTTAIWEMKLKMVAEGKEDVREFYSEIKSFTSKIVQDIFTTHSEVSFKIEKEILGICPKCAKGQIFEGKKGFGCSNWKAGCDFIIWKEIAQKRISSTVVKMLLTKKKSNKLKGFKSKVGKTFEAELLLNKDYKIEFNFNK